MTDNTELAAQQAAGLRQLADIIQANPHLAGDMRHTLRNSLLAMPLHNTEVTDERARLTEWVRLTKTAGAAITKDASSDRFEVTINFGAVAVRVIAHRDQVCERVVTGIREVTEEVPDPEALAAVPTVTQTRVVEDVDWVCRPLLAADTETAVAS
jgi:hypothetical protein